jgi:hypothetical protein
MKKLVLTVTAALACVGAFAQGKLQLATDGTHLIYYNPDPSFASGQMTSNAVYAANMPSGVTLVADLYGGTSSTSLTLISTTTFSAAAPGKITSANVTFSNPLINGGQTGWFQLQVRDNSHATAAAAQADQAAGWWGLSSIFSAVAQPSSFNPIYQATSPVFSTWAAGSFNMDNVAVGSRGAVAVTGPVVPEPSSMALLGLGAAALTIFRRRK